tara:strand:- start:306 stop:1745 length:1440 start_codon:yes stop_codon:yes gene_type:complete
MAFKMKGPGLPGFRKPAGSGFYKTKGYDINTSNRSPMKQGDETVTTTKAGYEEQLQNALAEEREKFASLSDEDQAKVNWEEIVTRTQQSVKDGITTTTKDTLQYGEFSAGNETIGGPKMSNEKWAEFVENNPDWNTTKVYREQRETNVDEKAKVKDTEWTNFKLGYVRVGSGQSHVKIDKNDGSFRYKMQTNDGGRFGEISANDINNLVKDGKFKYEVKGGKSTGKLLMSKDYYENTHQPMMQMAKEGEENRVAWQEESNEYRSNSRKQLRKSLIKEGIKEKNIFGKKTKEWKDAMRQGTKEYQSSRPDIWHEKVFTKKDGTEFKSYTNYGDNPPWMKGDPNYGTEVGVYNDDEVIMGTTTSNFKEDYYSGKYENAQGSRPNDWTKDAETGRYVLKEGAKTLDKEAWAELDFEEKKETLANGQVNGKHYRGKKIDGAIENPTGATPSHIANEEIEEGTMSADEDFDDGGDVSVRLETNE